MKIVRKSMLALLLAASVPMTGQAAGIVSVVATASDDIVVLSNAEATVTATGRTDLISGSYSDGFVVGTWGAEVTAGAVAYRLNRGVNAAVTTYGPRVGLAVNSSDSTKSVSIIIPSPSSAGTEITDNGWRVAQQGNSSITDGTIALFGASTLTPGSYPVGIDVAAYAY